MSTTAIIQKKKQKVAEQGANGTVLGPEERRRFSELAIEHQSGLRIYVSTMGVANSCVDDFAQEALLIAYRKFDQFEEGTSFGAWVRSIARNLVLNELRKSKRRHEIRNETVTEFFLSQDPYQELADQEDNTRERVALQLCLGGLPANHRRLVTARYQDGRKATEMAAETGEKASTIRQSLQRIRRALAKCIDERSNGERSDEQH